MEIFNKLHKYKNIQFNVQVTLEFDINSTTPHKVLLTSLDPLIYWNRDYASSTENLRTVINTAKEYFKIEVDKLPLPVRTAEETMEDMGFL